MELMLDLKINPPKKKLRYEDKILLIGSCFSQEIGNILDELKFSILQNPNGILYDPLSIGRSLFSYINNSTYGEENLNYNNELWQSFQHHSVFSDINKEKVLKDINDSQKKAHQFLKNADWLIITLGTAYYYEHIPTRQDVANCHKIPQSNFNKKLAEILIIEDCFNEVLDKLKLFNPNINILFTVSPVRYIKDGITENNRSKARLIEAVHSLREKYTNVFYFPAYELVADVLRDYRFYKANMVHPNALAVQFVFEKFIEVFFEEKSRLIAIEINKIISAKNHKPFNAATTAHALFKETQLKKIAELKVLYPQLNFEKEIKKFTE